MKPSSEQAMKTRMRPATRHHPTRAKRSRQAMCKGRLPMAEESALPRAPEDVPPPAGLRTTSVPPLTVAPAHTPALARASDATPSRVPVAGREPGPRRASVPAMISRVLVVDDDRDEGALLQDLLNRRG